MSALTVIIGIWATVGTCAVLFIRGASPRLARTTISAQRQPMRSTSLVE